jgi:hypothetical protein
MVGELVGFAVRLKRYLYYNVGIGAVRGKVRCCVSLSEVGLVDVGGLDWDF